MSGKDFLQISHYNKDEILQLLELSAKLKREMKEGTAHHLLKGKTLAMIFEKQSTRTRISFETGMFQLGGHAINISGNEINMGSRESIEDVARTVSRYVDCVMIRALYHWTLEAFAAAAPVPLINGLSDHHHPCQALADIFTIQEHKGDLSKVVLCYVGDGNNVCNSLIEICRVLDIQMRIACPPGYEPLLKEPSRNITIVHDPIEACGGSDVIYTDVWVSMGQEELTARKINEFQGYMVDNRLMKAANKDAVFMHCLPAHRGLEVDAAVFESKRSIVFDQAENRMHCQKAILASLLS